jgi:hypothetical protein
MVLKLIVGELYLENMLQALCRLQPNVLFLEQDEHVQLLLYDDPFRHLVP